MEKLYDTPLLSIAHDTEHNWLYLEWKGLHNADTAREGGETVLHYLKGCPCHKMLSDNSQVSGNWDKSASWVGGYYYEQLAELGVQSVAWLCPPHWSARKSMETAMQFVGQPVVMLFDDMATAYAWLMRQP